MHGHLAIRPGFGVLGVPLVGAIIHSTELCFVHLFTAATGLDVFGLGRRRSGPPDVASKFSSAGLGLVSVGPLTHGLPLVLERPCTLWPHSLLVQ